MKNKLGRLFSNFILRKYETLETKIVIFKRFSSSRKENLNQGLTKLLTQMPKEPKATSTLRHYRIKNKALASQKGRYPPGIVYISVLGNGGKGNPHCLYLFADNSRYMFNCGEGSQRLSQEYKMKLPKLEHIFFTHKSWQNIGGLSGIALTLQDVGVPEICLHGPPGIENLFDYTKCFMNIQNISISPRHPDSKSFSDHCMNVEYIPILSNEKRVFHRAYLEVAPSSMDQEGRGAKNDGKDNKKMKGAPEMVVDTSVAFICRINNKLGELRLAKCVELGVKPGPLLGQLKNGHDVTLPCGRIVKASDVVAPEEPGAVFIVIECPNENFLENLLNAEAFKKHQTGSDSPDLIASVVIHFTSPEIIKKPMYQEWMKRFPSETNHLFLNSDCASLSSIGLHEMQHKLNLVDPFMFPLAMEIEEQSLDNDTNGLKVNPAKTLLKYCLRPNAGIDHSSVPILDTNVFDQELEQIVDFNDILAESRRQIKNVQCPQNLDREYPEVVFLGTGSSIPTKNRNVSSILVNLGPETSLMMDCGEGTYRQLWHFYGCEKTAEVLRNLSTIFVSHLHADHHLGLFQLLFEREAAFEAIGKFCPPLFLIAPRNILSWLTNYHEQFQRVAHLVRVIPNYLLLFERRAIRAVDYDQLIIALNIKDITTVGVKHCFNAYGLTFTTKDNFKMVYSGDTMPCDSLVKAGLNCNLLIHEATMEDDLADDAIMKTHSTTSQAIEIGQKMNAQYTLLTHFSQRYAKLPLYNDNFANNVGFAFDNMRIQPKHFPTLPFLLPPLKCLFHESYDEMVKRKEQKMYKKLLVEKLMNN